MHANALAGSPAQIQAVERTDKGLSVFAGRQESVSVHLSALRRGVFFWLDGEF